VVTGSEYRHRIAAEFASTSAASGAQYAREDGVYFFLSFDLVNSTAYKSRNTDWKYRMRMFYDAAKNYWRNHEVRFRPHVWKYVGDEILFYSKISSVEELESAIRNSYSGLRNISGIVKGWTDNSSPSMYVKATCWAAGVAYVEPVSVSDLPDDPASPSRNITFRTAIGSGPVQAPVLDFLGPEIDAGFRIAHTSIKNALVVSAELANIVWTKGNRSRGDCLRVVDYRELKGVWDSRPYPLIWYREDWSEAAFAADYDYDDELRYDILRSACKAPATSMTKLEKVLSQVKRMWLTPGLFPEHEGVTDAVVLDEDELVTVTTGGMEVHCVAICFNAEGKVLLAKRADTKTVSPGCWEAGCAELKQGETFQDALKRDYLADFGLELDFALFNDSNVIATYSFQKRRSTIPGVILLANVKDAKKLKSVKHSDVGWFDVGEVSRLTEKCVPGLKEHIMLANTVWLSVCKP
jgi:isopentenyldiphosphate isomerase